MVYFLLTVHVKQRPNTFFSLSSISPDNINNKKAFQLKANRPIANRYIVCVYICVYDWGGCSYMIKFEQVHIEQVSSDDHQISVVGG